MHTASIQTAFWSSHTSLKFIQHSALKKRWLEDYPPFGARPIFRGELQIFGRVSHFIQKQLHFSCPSNLLNLHFTTFKCILFWHQLVSLTLDPQLLVFVAQFYRISMHFFHQLPCFSGESMVSLSSCFLHWTMGQQCFSRRAKSVTRGIDQGTEYLKAKKKSGEGWVFSSGFFGTHGCIGEGTPSMCVYTYTVYIYKYICL